MANDGQVFIFQVFHYTSI